MNQQEIDRRLPAAHALLVVGHRQGRALPIERAEGIYLYGPEGQRWLDFNSQLMSVNIGHSHPRVVEAIQKQAASLIYTFPGSATKVRAKLGKRLAELTPGNINTFFFTLGGAEANENAIKAARLYTGRHKILARYRSYHGATNATHAAHRRPAALGERARHARRGAGDGPVALPLLVRARPTRRSPRTTSTLPRRGDHLRGAAEHRGDVHRDGHRHQRHPAAAEGLPEGPARICSIKHGILLVCDEVMAGFGRTGKMFAFEHGASSRTS